MDRVAEAVHGLGSYSVAVGPADSRCVVEPVG